jgi:fibronectin type 3 domain-containing protein
MRPSRQLALSAAAVLAATFVVVDQAWGATATPAFGYGTPAFVNSAAPADLEQTVVAGLPGLGLVRSDQSAAGEPSLGIDWTTGAALYQSFVSTYKVTFDPGTTTSAGVHWSNVSSPYSKFNLDPILATDHLTGTTIAGGDDGACAVMSVTTTDGGTQSDPTAWTPSTPCPFAADHPTVGMGPYAGTPPVNATAPFVSYFCQQDPETGADECSHSVDGGLTWSPSIPDTAFNCASLFGHVKVSPDGTAYIPSANCYDANNNNRVGAIVTRDNGQSLTGFAIPDAPTPSDGFDPSIATDAANRVYETWSRDGDYHPVITWSDDHGATWAPQVDLSSTVSPALTASTFQAVVAGDAGRAAVAYLATTEPLNGRDPFTCGFVGHWNLYVSSTFDGGKTWQTVQATKDPVQRGEIDAQGTLTSGQRNLLDFMDASLTQDGRVVVAYADGCIKDLNTGVDCNAADGTEAESTSDYATVAYQTTGRGLFSAYDVTPVTAPSAPTLSATSGSGGVGLSWTVPASGGSPITGYQVSRGTSPGAETPLATVDAATTSYDDPGVTAGTTYYYTVSAVNAVGVGDTSNEVAVTPATTPAAPTASASDGNGKVALAWTVPADGGAPISGYQISRGLTPGAQTPYASVGTATSFVDTAVTAGTTYFYTVAATNSVGTGAPSAATSATPTTVPSAPTLTATAGKSQVKLTWTTPPDGGAAITGWAIYRGTASGAEQLVQTLSTGTSYVDTDVTGGTMYFYEVAAINRNGTGARSPEASATPKKGR